jgi:NADP-dependent 3-hydroxy acid dehydrogenase YdfG
VVTGASSGIGLATTRALAEAGSNVIATARRPETAESLREIADELSGLELSTLDSRDESVDSCIHSILTDLGVASSRPRQTGQRCQRDRQNGKGRR